MAVQVNNPGMAITAGEALEARRLIKSDGTYADLGATQDWVGITQEPRASGEQVPVRFTKAGTAVMTAAAALTAGDVVYKANDGKVSTVSTGSTRVGIALETATGDGAQIQVLPD